MPLKLFCFELPFQNDIKHCPQILQFWRKIKMSLIGACSTFVICTKIVQQYLFLEIITTKCTEHFFCNHKKNHHSEKTKKTLRGIFSVETHCSEFMFMVDRILFIKYRRNSFKRRSRGRGSYGAWVWFSFDIRVSSQFWKQNSLTFQSFSGKNQEQQQVWFLQEDSYLTICIVYISSLL